MNKDEIIEFLKENCYEGDGVAEYTVTTDDYNTYYCIIPEYSSDVAGALEDTLHLLLDTGHKDDIQSIMDAHVADEEEMQELDDDGWGYIPIDLGYIIPGEMWTFKKIY